MLRVLFLCSRNRLRSPTAERLFAGWPGVETDSAGLADDADTPLSADQLDGCALVCVMERVHLRRLRQRFGPRLPLPANAGCIPPARPLRTCATMPSPASIRHVIGRARQRAHMPPTPDRSLR